MLNRLVMEDTLENPIKLGAEGARLTYLCMLNLSGKKTVIISDTPDNVLEVIRCCLFVCLIEYLLRRVLFLFGGF